MSKLSSSRSSRVFARCRDRSMPISSITATANGSSSPARTPTESTKIRCLWKCFRIASAIGERIELWVQTKSTLVGRRSEEHTSELQSLMRISYAVFCLKKKKKNRRTNKRSQRTNDTEQDTHLQQKK